MSNDTTEWVWLNDQDACTPEYLLEASGLSQAEFDELVDIGVIVPIEHTAKVRRFQLRYVITALTARRLRDDFELDLHGVALAMTLMQRIDALQAELAETRAKLSR